MASALVATGIIVPIVVLSNKDDDEKIVTNNISESEYSEKSISIINSEIPYTQNNKETEEILTNIIFYSETNKLSSDSQSHEIYIEELKQTKYCIYSTLKLKCINLEHHQDIEPNDISFEFPIEGSTRKYNCDSINNNIIEKKIPSEVISGTIMLSIEKLNFIYEFSIDVYKEIKIKFQENIKFKFGDDMTITNDNITRCKNNYSIVYSFISPAKGVYDVELSSSIAVKDPIYLYADIDYDLTSAIRKGRNIGSLVKKSNSTRFTDFQKTIHGSFYLEENKEYFVKIAFLKNIGMHTYNKNGIRIIPNEDQNKKTHKIGFALYKIDCQNEMFYPFYSIVQRLLII